MKQYRKRKFVQTCTACGNTGHNRRRCTYLASQVDAASFQELPDSSEVIVLDSPKPVQTSRIFGVKKSTKKTDSQTASWKPSVMVHVVPDATSSPHVMNLKNDDRHGTMENMSVFQESSRKEKAVTRHDWSALIKEASAKQSASAKTLLKRIPLIDEMDESRTVAAVRPTRRTKQNNPFRLVRQIPARVSGLTSDVLDSVREHADAAREHVAELVYRLRSKFHIRLVATATLVVVLMVSVPFPAVGYYQRLKTTNGHVVNESTEAFRALQASTVAALHADLPTAQTELVTALQSFDEVNTIIDQKHTFLLSVAKALPVIGTQVKSREFLLAAGQHVALGNAYLIRGVETANATSGTGLTDSVSALRDHVLSAIPQYEEALRSLSMVDADALPQEYREPFEECKLLFAAFVDDLSDMADLAEAMRIMFGGEQFKRYLVVFQNHHELRATGGFPGSIAIIDVQKGRILNIEVPGGGPYDLQGQLSVTVKPPVPLQLLNKRWEFQDANWFPDFPASAEKLSWFYTKSRNTTVDGVIAINATVLERVLRVLGPVTAGDLTLTGDTVLRQLQEEVELNYDRTENRPKAVIGELLVTIQEQLKQSNQTQLVGLLTELHTALEQKEIQLWMQDASVETALQSFGWTGNMVATAADQDFLMAVDSNIRSQKTNAKIEQTIEHQAVVGEDGTITNTVVIKRTHHGVPNEVFYGAPNVSYFRLYVPEGAELVTAGGFTYPPEDAFRVPDAWAVDDELLHEVVEDEQVDAKTGTVVTSEFGKTAFGNWILTNPGETSEAYFTYRLPFRLPVEAAPVSASWKERLLTVAGSSASTRYSLLIEKQSGSNSVINSSVIFPAGWTPVWKSSSDIELANNGASLSLPLSTDLHMGVVVERTGP